MTNYEYAGEAPGLPIGRLFAKSFDVYRRSFGRFWASLVALFLPALVLGLIATLFDPPSLGNVVFAFLAIAWLVLAYLFFQGIVVKIVEDVEVQGRVVRPIGEMFSSAAPQIPNLIVLAVAYIAVYYAGLAFFIIPGIIVALKLFVAVPALFVDQRPVFASMARSAELTRGNLWRLLGVYLLIVIAGLILYFILLSILSESLELGLILGLITAVLVFPYLAMFTAVVYFELREVKQSSGSPAPANPVQPLPEAPSETPTLPPDYEPVDIPEEGSTRKRIDIDP